MFLWGYYEGAISYYRKSDSFWTKSLKKEKVLILTCI